MRPAVVIKMDPITDHPAGMLQCFKPLPMDALLFQRPDHSLDHAVLLRAMRRDELLFKPIASDQGCKAFAGKDQAIVRAQQERHRHPAKRSVPGNQGLLKRRLRGLRLSGSRQVVTQELSCIDPLISCSGHTLQRRTL